MRQDERLCAYCRVRPAEDRWFPFCSHRCRLMDLVAWIDGKYRIAGEPVSAEADVPVASEAEK
ncbi:MAG: DNA gyrase inhibitor YacG [Acidobacteriota bacterium]